MLRSTLKHIPECFSVVLNQPSKVTVLQKTCCWSPANTLQQFLMTVPGNLINLCHPDNKRVLFLLCCVHIFHTYLSFSYCPYHIYIKKVLSLTLLILNWLSRVCYKKRNWYYGKIFCIDGPLLPPTGTSEPQQNAMEKKRQNEMRASV